jgi:hypothetical protein
MINWRKFALRFAFALLAKGRDSYCQKKAAADRGSVSRDRRCLLQRTILHYHCE